MTIVEIAIKDIKANPFKKFINEGKLDEIRLEKLKESIEHGTLPEIFTCRKIDGEYQQAYGHHRLEAIKRAKGKDWKIQVNVVGYSDEQMLVDLVRENIVQRDTDFHDTEGSIVLARNWLKSGAEDVKRFNNIYHSLKVKQGNQGKRTDLGEDHIDFRTIATFLSKNGKAITYGTIKNYLDINDNLDKDLHDKTGKLESSTKENTEETIGIKIASKLATLEKKDQKLIYKQIKDSEVNSEKAMSLISTFKKADDSLKEKVRSGKESLEDLPLLVQAQDFKRPGKTPIHQAEAVLKLNNMIINLENEVVKVGTVLEAFNHKEVFEQLNDKEKHRVFSFLSELEKKANALLSSIQKVKNKL